MDSIPESGGFSGVGNGNLLQYSCLENTLNRGSWWTTVHWIAKSYTAEHIDVFCLPEQHRWEGTCDTQKSEVALCLLCVCAKSLQSCPTLCDAADCSPPGFSVHGILQARNWNGLPSPTPGDIPKPGIELTTLMSPSLAGGFFTSNATWEAPCLLCSCCCC